MIGEKTQRHDAAQQGCQRHEVRHALGDRQGHEAERVRHPKVALADVVQLHEQLDEAEEHHQHGEHQQNALDRVPAEVAVDDFDGVHHPGLR